MPLTLVSRCARSAWLHAATPAPTVERIMGLTARNLAKMAATVTFAAMPVAAEVAEDGASAVFGVKLPPGYRDWQLVSVAHETGKLNDIRAVLGNDIALKAYRSGTATFPDGAIIGRLAWKYVSSPENNAVFGRDQSFVAGPATNVQFMIKDSKQYANTGGWGFAQFESGQPNRDKALLSACFGCHIPAKTTDYVFTGYAR